MVHRPLLIILSALVLFSILLSQASPARADGAPFVPDIDVWSRIEEGQQIAVIHLSEGDTAQVDLCVSLSILTIHCT